ncbi:MAG: hypothetical protein M3444_04580 [Acidobacteriota bacterium]|nr:hypothetical protein [Acidobacteriota bacterium]
MNTQRLRSMFNRQNVVHFTFFFLLIVAAVFGFMVSAVKSSATTSGASSQKPPVPSDEELKKDFNDDDLKAKDDKPSGTWGYSMHLDDNQMNDPGASLRERHPVGLRGREVSRYK